MSLKLDELRKRLLQQGQQGGASPEALRTVPTIDTPASEVSSPKVLEITRPKVSESEPIEGAPAHEEVSAPQPALEPKRSAPPTAVPRNNRSREATISAGEHQLAEAVAKVFEQTEAFQGRFKELRAMFDPIEQTGKTAADAFAPLNAFHEQLARLA